MTHSRLTTLTTLSKEFFTAGITCASLSLLLMGLTGGRNTYFLSQPVSILLGATGGVLGASSFGLDAIATSRRKRGQQVASLLPMPFPNLPLPNRSIPFERKEAALDDEILEPEVSYRGRLNLTARWAVPNPAEFVQWLYKSRPQVFEGITRPEVILHYPHPDGGMAYHIVIHKDLFPLASIAAFHAVVTALNDEETVCYWEFSNGVISSLGASKLRFYEVENALI